MSASLTIENKLSLFRPIFKSRSVSIIEELKKVYRPDLETIFRKAYNNWYDAYIVPNKDNLFLDNLKNPNISHIEFSNYYKNLLYSYNFSRKTVIENTEQGHVFESFLNKQYLIDNGINTGDFKYMMYICDPNEIEIGYSRGYSSNSIGKTSFYLPTSRKLTNTVDISKFIKDYMPFIITGQHNVNEQRYIHYSSDVFNTLTNNNVTPNMIGFEFFDVQDLKDLIHYNKTVLITMDKLEKELSELVLNINEFKTKSSLLKTYPKLKNLMRGD